MVKSGRFEYESATSSSTFAGRPIDLQFAKPYFTKVNQDFLVRAEEIRKGRGSAIAYIDLRDAPYDVGRPSDSFISPSDQDNGMHYSLVGFVARLHSRNRERWHDLLMGGLNTMPLPVFAYSLGFATVGRKTEEDAEENYQLTCNFSFLVNFLTERFSGRLFLAGREDWECSNFPIKLLRQAPQLTTQNLGLLAYYHRELSEINDPIFTQNLERVRAQAKLPSGRVTQKELVAVMRMTEGTNVLASQQKRVNISNYSLNKESELQPGLW